MKKLMSLILVLVMLCALTACGGSDDLEKLAGTWEMVYAEDADVAKSLLELMEFYPEEIALADMNSLQMVLVVEFTMDKTYCYTYDTEGCKAHVRAFYDSTIHTLYENRNGLTDTYGYEIVNMTEDEFKQFYADLFGMATYGDLLTYFVDNSFDYSALVNIDVGTFRLSGSKIICTATGASEEEEMSFSLDGDTLTLIYVDGKEVYTRK